MKNSIRFSLLIMILSFVASSCGKYEDGPGFSLKSKEARVINIWSLDQQIINDRESDLTTLEKEKGIEFIKDGKAVYTDIVGNSTKDYDATWEFSDDKEKLNCYVSHILPCVSYIDTIEYTILRLTSNEMWLTEFKLNATFEYHYVTKK